MVQNEIKMRKPKSRELIHALVQDWRLYVLLLPVVLWFALWAYKPMGGLLIAFKRYDSSMGIWMSEFKGIDNFVNLVAGVNRTSVKLEYTSARIRIGVRNYSDVDLSISDLTFSDNFTQSTCYLFSRLNSDENYAIATGHHGKGAPIATHANAITPFVPDQIITKDMGVTTIFDGLIYESRDLDNNYVYSLELGADVINYHYYEPKNGGQRIHYLSEIDSEGPYFLIRRRGEDNYEVNSYLYVENDKVYASPDYGYTPQQVLDNCREERYYNYVWELVKSGSGYYIRNVETEDYIEKIRTNNTSEESARLQMVGWEEYRTAADTFTAELADRNNGYFLFRSNSFQSSSAYLNVRDNNVVGWNGFGAWSQFVLFPVEQIKDNTLREAIVLRTIDSETGVASDVHEIKRNDFIRVQVGVTYNPYRGNFDFVVEDWTPGGGEITFN